MRDLIGWQNHTHNAPDAERPARWKPHALPAEQWPPDYQAVWRWRADMLRELKNNPAKIAAAKAYYSTRPEEFMLHWMDTYDPRRADYKWIPFIFFMKQSDLIAFFQSLDKEQESGLIEKSRDMGATWVACGYSIWCFLFLKGDNTGWGSRKEQLVDKLGDPDSIFEKMRLLLKRIPSFFLPDGFAWSRHATYMKLVNPENGSTITGEAGDNIGRGGRKAQPLDAPVLTPTGWRQMGDIQPGDKVTGPNGKPVLVTGVKYHGLRNVYKITFNDGSSTECDLEHLWQVQDKLTRKNLSRSKQIRGDEWQVITTEDLMPKLNYSNKELNFTIPIVKPIKFKKRKIDLDPYVVGVLLGDGHVKQTEKRTPTFTSIDREIVEQVSKRLPEGVILRSYKDGRTYGLIDERIRCGRGVKSPMKQLLYKYNLANHGALDKFIPDIYKFNSIENRLLLLQGLMDTDGYVVKRKNAGKVCIALSSKKLSDDVQWLVQSLGGVARQTVKKTTHADSYVLTINLPHKFNPFLLPRKATEVGKRSKYKISRAIEKIEFSRRTKVKCITVDGGLYVTNHCIVTHNSRYFKDEAAHYERPEKIEAALGDNTNVQIDISSVNGLGNVFHRRREHGVIWQRGKTHAKGFVRVFIMDWKDHPNKTQEWYDLRKAKYEREGLAHVFAQEVDRNYSAAVSNTVIPYEWIKSAVDAHIHIPYIAKAYDPENSQWVLGLDVADDGEDRNSLTLREWIIWRHCEEWGDRDPGVVARRAIIAARPHKGRIRVMYDAIGIGAGVKGEYNRLTQDEGLINPNELPFVPWNAGAGVQRPYDRIIEDDDESMTNKAFFANLKAQAWWSLRTRFYKTHKARTEGVLYPADELISIDSTMPLLEQLCKELAQPTRGQSGQLKMLIDKKPPGTKSPNNADGGVMAFFPLDDDGSQTLVGKYGH